jgi:hypothetical protein
MELKEGMLVRHVTGGPVMVVESIGLVGVAKVGNFGDQMTRAILPGTSLRAMSETEIADYRAQQAAEIADTAIGDSDAD